MRFACLTAIALWLAVPAALAQTAAKNPPRPGPDVDTWVEASGEAAGTNANAKDEAVKDALRKCVEKACGVFLTSKTKTQDYKTVYDKVFANTAGYVLEYKIVKQTTEDETSKATVRARVSTVKFEEEWARVAHTIAQEGYPRVIIAVAEVTYVSTATPAGNWVIIKDEKEVKEAGAVQSKLEEFFIDKGVAVVDKQTSSDVNKRDILLASLKDDTAEVAALGARFKAEVVIVGQATSKFGKEVVIAGQTMYQFTSTLTVRAIQTDSARVIMSKSFGPFTTTSLQKNGGEDKAFAKMCEDAPKEVLTAVAEAWRKRANVGRTVNLQVSGMDYKAASTFEKELKKLDGVTAVNIREITESVANIDVEYKNDTRNLADRLMEMKDVKLEVVEFNTNRLKLKVVK
jgi:hypothetical protein